MRSSYISLLIFILLFSGCNKNSFLIKKRYSKGFYIDRSNKIKTEGITFSSYSHNTTKEQITKQESELKGFPLKDESIIDKPTQAFRAPKALVQHQDNLIDKPMKILKQTNKTRYSDNAPRRHLFSGITLLLVLALIVTLAKVFGILFIYVTSFIIAFTAISIFFIIRTHLN